MEGVPAEINLTLLEKALLGISGVTAIYDLHAWTITSGMNSLSAHVVVADMKDAARVLKSAQTVLKETFKIDHVTIQVEDAEMRAAARVLRI